MTDFADLHTHSEYSLRDGSLSISNYVDWLAKQEINRAALTDTHNLFGAFKFYRRAREHNIHPVVGVDLFVKQTASDGWQSRSRADRLLVFVKNSEGYSRLSRLLSESYRHRRERGGLWVSLDEIAAGQHDLLFLGPPGPGSDETAPSFKAEQFRSSLRSYREVFGPRAGVEIPLYSSNKKVTEERINLAREFELTPVPTHPSYFSQPEDFETLRLRRAVQSNTRLSDLESLPDHRREQSLMGPDDLRSLLPDGESDLLDGTSDWVSDCDFTFETESIRLPEYEFAEASPADTLNSLCKRGRDQKSLAAETAQVTERLQHELDIIEDMGFTDYFLIVADVVNWAKKNDIRVGPGRGSAAGSLVAYLTDITDVDPFEYDLIFERFLNPDRNEMPDIDIDFADHQRDEVINYIRKRFGEKSVAQIITFGQMRARNSIRDVGRIRGEDQADIDSLAESVPSYADRTLEDLLDDESVLNDRFQEDPDLREWLRQSLRLEGFVRNPSIHAAGLLIVDGPIEESIPLYYPDENGPEPASQFDMYDVEALGFLKLDVLGLTTLTLIDYTLRRIPENRRPSLDQIPENDPETLDLFANRSLEGVFQFESQGGRDLAHQMEPKNKGEVVDCIALNRPGPAQYRDNYLQRRAGTEDVSYPHPDLEPILEDTYGLIIYQEQVMAIARTIGGFSWSESDIMRKAMGKKKQTLMDKLRDDFVTGAVENGYDETFAKDLFEKLARFAEYGFNRSHSAAYGEITYRTAYLKAHFPGKFYASFLTLKANDRDRIKIIYDSMKEDGLSLLKPDVNRSMREFSSGETGVRYGLLAIKHVGSGLARTIEQNRNNGPFETIEDFLERIPPDQIQAQTLQSMAAAGCFDDIHPARSPLIENAQSLIEEGKRAYAERSAGQEKLFAEEADKRQTIPTEESWSNQRLRRAQMEATGVVFDE